MASPTSDAELIALARSGDDRAFGALVERYEGAVATTAIGMLGDGDEADDVGQETFIRFHRSLHRFRGESSLKTYLVHIAMNLSINVLRRRRRSLLRFVSGDIRDDEGEAAMDLTDPEPGPDRAVEAAELQRLVRAAVARLGEKHRAVVVLRLFHEYSTRETAALLGVPEGTVLSRLSRALKELEAQLEPYVRRGAILAERLL